MTHLQRNIIALREKSQLGQEKFGALIGATRGMIAAYEGGEGSPKAAVMENIQKRFGITRKQLFEEDIDVEKLTFTVTRKEPVPYPVHEEEVDATTVSESDFMQVPVLTTYAQAGYLSRGADLEAEKRFDVMLIPREYEKGHYLVAELQGDSMNDGTSRALVEGDKFLVKELDKIYWKNKLHIHSYVWVIVHREGIAFKEIIEHDVAKGKIVCHSWNPLFTDYEVNLKDVYRLFYVKKLVERRIKL